MSDKGVDWTVADPAGDTGLQDNDGKLIFLPCDSFLMAFGGLLRLSQGEQGALKCLSWPLAMPASSRTDHLLYYIFL